MRGLISEGHGRRSDRENGKNPAIDIINFKDENFDQAWEVAKKSPTEIDRLFNLTLVVGKASKTAHPVQILEKIRGEFGPGRSRNQLIGALFMNAPNSIDLTNAYQALEFDDERKSAQAGIAQAMAMLESPADFRRQDYSYLEEDLDKVITSGLDGYISRFYSSSEEELGSAFLEAMQVDMSLESRANLIAKVASKAPFDCWEYLNSNDLSVPPEKRNEIITRMIYRDSERAISQVVASKNSETYLAYAFRQWLENDARKPVEWLSKESQNLSNVKQSRAVQGIVDFSMSHGDFEVASQWAKQMADPALRNEILATIEKKKESATKKEHEAATRN